jgi:hypothetical protein
MKPVGYPESKVQQLEARIKKLEDHLSINSCKEPPASGALSPG